MRNRLTPFSFYKNRVGKGETYGIKREILKMLANSNFSNIRKRWLGLNRRPERLSVAGATISEKQPCAWVFCPILINRRTDAGLFNTFLYPDIQQTY